MPNSDRGTCKLPFKTVIVTQILLEFVITSRSTKEILSSQKFIDKGKDYDMLMPWLGEGLLTSAGNAVTFPDFKFC